MKQRFLFSKELTALSDRELIMSLKIIRRARLMHPAPSADRANIYRGARSRELNRVLFAANSARDSIVIERG